MGIYARTKKVLAGSNYNCPAAVRRIACIRSGFRRGSVHLYIVLIRLYESQPVKQLLRGSRHVPSDREPCWVPAKVSFLYR